MLTALLKASRTHRSNPWRNIRLWQQRHYSSQTGRLTKHYYYYNDLRFSCDPHRWHFMGGTTQISLFHYLRYLRIDPIDDHPQVCWIHRLVISPDVLGQKHWHDRHVLGSGLQTTWLRQERPSFPLMIFFFFFFGMFKQHHLKKKRVSGTLLSVLFLHRLLPQQVPEQHAEHGVGGQA